MVVQQFVLVNRTNRGRSAARRHRRLGTGTQRIAGLATTTVLMMQMHLVVMVLQLHVESLWLVVTLIIQLLIVGIAASWLAQTPVECQPQVAPL